MDILFKEMNKLLENIFPGIITWLFLSAAITGSYHKIINQQGAASTDVKPC